jgi:DNA-binding response OmpR family regulator
MFNHLLDVNYWRVVTIEDDAGQAELIGRAIHRWSDQVQIVHLASGREVMSSFFNRNSEGCESIPSLILLDIHLGDMDGLDILRHFRETDRYRFVPIIMLTSSDIEEEVLRAYEHHANSFVVKATDHCGAFMEEIHAILDYWLCVNRPVRASAFRALLAQPGIA